MSMFRSIPMTLIFVVIVVYGLLYAVTLGVLHKNGYDAAYMIGASFDAGDSYEYIALAKTMLTDGRFAMSATAEPEPLRTPGYPFFIAIILAVFGDISFLPLAQIVLVALSCALIFLIGERFFSRGIALGAAVLFAIEPAVITGSFTSASDILFVFLLLCGIYILTVRTHSPLRLLFGGVLMGAMTLIRPMGLYVIPLVLCWLVWEARGQWRTACQTGILFLLGAVLVVVPWMVRNYVLFGHFSPSSTGSYNLLFYAQEFEHQYTGKSKVEVSAESRQKLGAIATDRIETFRFADRNFALAMEVIRAHPFAYTAFHVYSMIPFYFGSSIDTLEKVLYQRGIRIGQQPPDINISVLVRTGDVGGAFKALTSDIPVLLERLVWLVLFIAALFTVAGAVYKRKAHAALFALFFALILAFGLMTGPVAYSRYRLPAEPFIFLLGCAGIASGLRRLLNHGPH